MKESISEDCNRPENIQMKPWKGRQTDGEKDRCTDRQTDRQTDTQRTVKKVCVSLCEIVSSLT